MRVYYTTTNNGDGSASVSFFESQAAINALEDADPETYGSGEGGGFFDVPDGTEVTGITIYSEERVMAAIAFEEEEGNGYVDLDYFDA